ncbi:MAG TPA: N-acetylmuramoyl-L-alanine amidase [Clostridiales bacterium]|nr:N-acetylmuramoyl-L-alanine amidase [Clostridiales bacterium]
MDIKKENVARPVRWIALAVFLSISFTLFFSASGLAGMIPFSVKTTKDELNIRVKADTFSDILTVIETAGTALYPVEENGNWYKIRFANNLYGYVFKAYVEQGDAFPTKISLFPGAALRTSTNADAQVHTICSTGGQVSVMTYDDTWYYVTTYRGEKGYMLKSSLYEPTPAYPVIEGQDVEVELDTLVKVTSATANIRSGPSTSYAKVITVTAGTILTVISQTNGSDGYVWYKISTSGGTEGYIRSDLVTAYSTETALAGKVVAIDPGHGCYKTDDANTMDDGNVGPSGLLEKDVNLAVSLYLKAYLQASGATVVMTRSKDVGVMTLASRAATANDANADIFISVHCNASITDSKKNGVITYYFGGNAATPVSATLLAKRKALAADVQNALVAENGSANLGTGSDGFTVLVKSTMPSVLVEIGYITNPEEEALLATAAYQQLCGKGIYKGVLKYFETN